MIGLAKQPPADTPEHRDHFLSDADRLQARRDIPRRFCYCNSDDAILRFPFPFPEDGYMYSVNIEPHVRGGPTGAFQAAFDDGAETSPGLAPEVAQLA